MNSLANNFHWDLPFKVFWDFWIFGQDLRFGSNWFALKLIDTSLFKAWGKVTFVLRINFVKMEMLKYFELWEIRIIKRYTFYVLSKSSFIYIELKLCWNIKVPRSWIVTVVNNHSTLQKLSSISKHDKNVSQSLK